MQELVLEKITGKDISVSLIFPEIHLCENGDDVTLNLYLYHCSHSSSPGRAIAEHPVSNATVLILNV